ncbi:NAD(P)-binding protein [Pholiota conissans]|uniref:NAD(P)-binding protein n=1 Tax=Pholiota conissans TaxID=109636 RepID=A0A9P5ZDB9_9AGAR|nr:NAD(P)-binding protein [Pholiota conissans]
MFPFSSATFTPENDLPDLTGKVIFVTGANHGIGYATVKHLAGRGAKVYLGSRSEEKGLAAVASLELELADLSSKGKDAAKRPTPGKVIYHHCDMSTPAQAKETAEKLIEKEERLDVLINNAGVLADKAIQDQIMMVNHFGTFQITQSLLPLLIKTAKEPNSDVRIVYVGSDAHKLGRAKDPNIHFKTEADFKPDTSKDWFPAFSTYCISKLTNVLTLKAWQRRVAENNITCLVVHPGAVNTFADRLPLRFLLNPIVNLFFVSPDVGAYNSCFAAASPLVKAEPEKYRGAYLVPTGKVKLEGENARNEALQEEIWESTVRILGEWEAKASE